MFRSRIVAGVAALVALAAPAGIVAAGTSEPGEPPADTTVPTDAATATTVADGSAPADGTTPDGEGGDGETGAIEPPSAEAIQFEIDMMLGLVPQEEMEQHWAEQEEARQLAVQACMNEAGFEYELETYPVSDSGPGGLDWGSPEFAEQYGFGIWTMMDPESSGAEMAMEEYEWPNDDIVNSLTPEEQNAWFEVQGRCMNDAFSGQDDFYRNPDVQQIMEDFWTDVENDPRMREAQDGWVDCMEAAGFPYPDQEAMHEDVSAGDNETYELHNQFYESEAWEETSEDHAEWQALVDHEIEVAVANAECQPPVDEVRETVQQDLREELIAVWQTIDWSQPPVTYPGEGDVFLMPGESIPLGSEPEDTAPETTGDGSGAATESTDEPQVGLDLGGDPTDTTEA